MKDTEESVPFAVGAIRKGLPILDRNLKGLIEEIQEKAKTACQTSKGTPTQEIACAVSREVQEREISDAEELKLFLEDMVYSLKRKIIDIPDNEYLLNKIESMRNEKNTGKKLRTLSFIIENLPTIKVVSEQVLDKKLDQKLQKFDLIFNELANIKDKLSCISFDITNIKWNSADVMANLKTMKKELEKLNEIEGLNTLSFEKLNSSQAEKLNDLDRDILERLNEVKVLIDNLPKNNDIQEFHKKFDELRQSNQKYYFKNPWI